MVAPDTIKPSIAATSHTTMRRAVGGGMHVDAPLIARRDSRGQASSDFLTRPPVRCDQWGHGALRVPFTRDRQRAGNFDVKRQP